MLRLRSLFVGPPAKKIISARRLKFVQRSFLVYVNIYQTRAVDSITAEIGQIMNETLSENRQIQNLVLAVDLVCTTDVIADGESQQLARKILQFVDRKFPNMRDRFVGITGDENKLPLQGLLISGALALEEIDNEHLFVME